MQNTAANLRSLTQNELHSQLKVLAEKERRITTEILHHFQEIDRRMLYAEMGYSSLFQYAVSELKYDEASAYRRIASMRLLREIPSLEEKINSGVLTVSNLTLAQTFFRKEKKSGRPTSTLKRKEILTQLESKSKREALTYFAELSPEINLSAEMVTPLNKHYVELKIPISKKLQDKLDTIKNLLAHQHDGSYEGVLEVMADLVLKKITLPVIPTITPSMAASRPLMLGSRSFRKSKNSTDPEFVSNKVKREEPSETNESLSPEKVIPKKLQNGSQIKSAVQIRSRHITAEVKRQVYLRDQGHCTYQESATGKKCQSRYRLQYEHKHPFALGGENSAENITLHCYSHNRFNAMKVFGSIYETNRFVNLKSPT